MKRIIIDVHDSGITKGIIEIKSKEYGFDYSYSELGGGMQCNFMGGTDEYARLLEQLHEISEVVRYIEINGIADAPKDIQSVITHLIEGKINSESAMSQIKQICKSAIDQNRDMSYICDESDDFLNGMSKAKEIVERLFDNPTLPESKVIK